VQKAVELSAREIGEIFSDLKRYDNNESNVITEHLFNFVVYLINDEWPILAKGRKDDNAWRLYYEIEDKILNLQPDSQQRRILKNRLIKDIAELTDHRYTMLYVVENPTAAFHAVVLLIFAVSTFLFGVNKFRMPVLISLLIYCIMIGIVIYSNMSLEKPFQGYFRVHRTSFQTIYDTKVIDPTLLKQLNPDKPAQ
jgi:hypothetical protein